MVLAFALLGFVLLRSIIDQISTIHKSFTVSLEDETAGAKPFDVKTADELRGIVESFDTLNDLFKNNLKRLDQESTKILTLKELSNLCYITFDVEELLYITLERALAMVQAESGSVLILERPHQDKFIIQTTIGREDKIRKGDRVDFATSMAKYAVINKAPLLVVDAKQDKRFGKHTRFHYDTESFICMHA